ncbi:Lrp/AsnC family transcriptional regulator [Amylibacter sp. IMCC11727]|uniref:Lrp/AsnC family transcriptional regulator n=1 Tax=Amylibacter sp. IMCC11727 TaxID=3039851 RepID=UPI00244DF75C|nr:Lrp/AsnC family transcriptional regulator [Amylibacter sp. IMCC11727]WGI21180.1 Lrp/AsnC family transcriptional regulator [Amylibacter sp. IMCC11727]
MLDSTDLKLLSALQDNATATAQELSETLHLSASQIGRRRQRLEEAGYILGYHAHVSPKHLGLDVQAFVQVAMVGHTTDNAKQFEQLVDRTLEVVSLWTLTGDADYMLRVYCKSLAALNTLVHEVFLPHEAVARVQTKIVMKQLKKDTGLPID